MPDARAGDLPDLWLFDFDRTLALLEPVVDWAGSRRELEVELRATQLPAALLDELITAIPRGNLVLYEALRARLLDAPAAPVAPVVVDAAEVRAILARASAVIERHELAGVADAIPMRGAMEMLRALAARSISIAVVTSNSSRTVARWLAIHRESGLLSVIVGRDSGLALKPSPAMLQRALQPRGDRQAIFVGDSEADLRAAHSAKVRFIGIAPEAERRGQLLRLGVEPGDVFDSAAAVGIAFGIL